MYRCNQHKYAMVAFTAAQDLVHMQHGKSATLHLGTFVHDATLVHCTADLLHKFLNNKLPDT